MTRADDLRELIRSLEADETLRLPVQRDMIVALLGADRDTARDAVVGHLDAVARLEAPLLARG